MCPPLWHRVLRKVLTSQASRLGLECDVEEIEGGLFDTTLLYDVRCRPHGLPLTIASAAEPGPAPAGTNFRVARAELTLAWRIPFFQHPAPSWVNHLVLDGISGQIDLNTKGQPSPQSPDGWRAAGLLPTQWLDLPLSLLADKLALVSHKIVPARFRLACNDLLLRRGRFWLHWRGGLLTGARDESGQFLAHEAAFGGPGYENTLADRHAETFWKDGRLTFANLELRPTVVLRSATLDGSRLDRGQLDWDGDLDALGGSLRGQGSMDFSRRRLGLEISCSLAGVQVRPLAKTLGIDGVSDGQVVQSSFTFRGDLENWLAGEMWMNGRVTDFRWRQRRWESLDLRAIVMNRHVQVHELELRQSRNQLSFHGECALPPLPKPEASDDTLPQDWWQHAAFACNIDARLDDLKALSNLLSPELPELQGRMSINGKITARGGDARGFEGYLNVEGSALLLRQAPLDNLRSTLVFHGDELQVADLQTTHNGDYLTGKGTLKILGPLRYEGELRASAKDLAVYAPAYVGLLSPQPISGALRLEWSGDGTAGAHSGSFQGSMERFFTSAGGGVMPRPVNLETEGTYSPVSLSVRRLTLADGEGKGRHDAINLEGAVPWNQDAQQWAVGHWMDTTRPMTVRAECTDAPLDVLAALVPGVIHAARGRISGTLEAKDAWRAPLLNGALKIKGADFLWTAPGQIPVESVDAAVHIEQSMVYVDECHGTRAGEGFELKGKIDLHDTADPDLDLTLAGQKALRSEDGRFKARTEYALNVRGTQRAGMTLSGEFRLSDGYIRRRVEFTGGPFPDEFDPAPADLLSAFAEALPRSLLAARLDLRVTTNGSFAVDEVTAQGELAADLALTGTWADPHIAGFVTMRKGTIFLPQTELLLTEGVLYFTEDRPGDPTLSAIATTRAEQGGTGKGNEANVTAYFVGTRNEGVATSWSAEAGGGDIFSARAWPDSLMEASVVKDGVDGLYAPVEHAFPTLDTTGHFSRGPLYLHLR